MRAARMGVGIAALWMTAAGAAAPGEPPVRVSVERREGAGTTVCLEAASGVRGRKRALVSHAGGSAVLDVSPHSPGPHCTELARPQGTVSVELQFTRLWVLPSTLRRHSYPAQEASGRRITFLWVRD